MVEHRSRAREEEVPCSRAVTALQRLADFTILPVFDSTVSGVLRVRFHRTTIANSPRECGPCLYWCARRVSR